MNPPFGGKEGKEAQTPYDYKTGATQVLFLQNVLKSMKTGSTCGIVLDEGVLFRTNEGGFVKTKRKLLEEFNVWCIISLPGGVFTSAGAGVKTNLVFFSKGPPTETIWYFDLSDVKVGKKTPLTKAHFDDLFRLLPTRGDSDRSWTVPFATKLQRALDEARPYRERATQQISEASLLEDELKERRKHKAESAEALVGLEERWKTSLREARETESKAQTIEDAVYDLKAVNPNKTDDSDKRTPTQLLSFIEEKGREADAALARLQALTRRPTSQPNGSKPMTIKAATVGLELPEDFPIVPYNAIHDRVHATRRDEVATFQYGGAWNAVAYRFLSCANEDHRFTELVAAGSTPPQPQRFHQEEALFNFFVNGLSAIESFFYGLHWIGSMAMPGTFPILTGNGLRDITVKETMDRFDRCAHSSVFAAPFSGLRPSVAPNDSTEYETWKEVRNILAHRASYGRLINLSSGGGRPPLDDVWRVNDIPINDQLTRTRRAWLATTLTELMEAADVFARNAM